MSDDVNNSPESLVERYFDETLGDLERKSLLERVGREAAEIEIDLAAGGPLAAYIRSRREDAKEALRVLVTTNPKDGVSIALAQASVNEYLRVIQWIAARASEAEDAERIIADEYGRNGERIHDD